MAVGESQQDPEIAPLARDEAREARREASQERETWRETLQNIPTRQHHGHEQSDALHQAALHRMGRDHGSAASASNRAVAQGFAQHNNNKTSSYARELGDALAQHADRD